MTPKERLDSIESNHAECLGWIERYCESGKDTHLEWAKMCAEKIKLHANKLIEEWPTNDR